MKKYLQFNNPHYGEIRADVGAGRPQIQSTVDPGTGGRGSGILDLSGRMGTNSVAMVTGQKWPEAESEQEAALDLSRTRQESQEEALDLSKPSTSRPDRPSSQSYQPTQTVSQSHRLVHTPPASRQTRSPAGQPYSLLQAALNSNQPNAGLHNMFDKINQPSVLASMLEQQRALRFHAAGMSAADYGRTIKPFSNLSSRPLGITVPHMSHTSGAVIQGNHKPIAITTPQPHNSSATTKSQNISNATVSVTNASQSVTSTCNQGFSVSQSNYSTGNHSQISQQLNSAKMNSGEHLKTTYESLKDPVGGLVERYLIQPPEGLNRLVGNLNVMPTEPLAGFACAQCAKTFKTKAALKLHTTVHKTAEERQYACNLCSRRFLHRHHLVVHQRKHSGEKPFKCEACAKTFMAIFLLHKHLRKHSRETGNVSMISLNQLKQLHDKKLINVGTHSIPGLSPAPFDNDSVIVLDDDDDAKPVQAATEDDSGKLDRKRYEKNKAGNLLDLYENEPNLILEKIKADLQKQQAGNADKENDMKNVNVHKASVENNAEKINTNEITPPKAPKPEYVESKNITDIKEKMTLEENDENTLSAHELESSELESSELTIENENTPVSIKQEAILTLNSEDKEVVDPFPEYGSDDEVELDPITGNIKVIGKKKEVPNVKTEENEVDTMKEKDLDTNETEIKMETDNAEVNDKEKHSAKQSEMTTNNVLIPAEKDENATEELNIKIENVESLAEEAKEVLNESKDETNMPLEKHGSSGIIPTAENSQECLTSPHEQRHEVKESQNKETKKKESIKNNIFEKLNEIKGSDNVEFDGTQNEKADKVDREVAVILSIIKQKLCEKEDGPSKPKKPKLDNKTECLKKLTINVTDIAKDKPVYNINELSQVTKSDNVQPSRRKGKKKAKKVKCEICSRSFQSNHYLVLHMAVHKKNPMLQALRKAKDYQMKALGFINKANVTCEICHKVFKFQKSLNSHMRVHSEKMIQTKLYRKAFRDFMAEAAPPSSRSNERSQSQNNETESQIRRFSVIETSTNKESVKLASQLKHVSFDGDESNVLTDDQYDDPPIRTMIGEDNIKRYLCHACDNTYTTKQKLRMHALIHKDNCFLCDICGKSFFRHITLDKHLSTHKLPRPHICDVCKKTFIHRSSLMRHKVVHDKAAISNTKQNSADLNFEMKMYDTYTMLRQERMNKVLVEPGKLGSIKGKNKYDPLDLTVRIRPEDCLPPVLSPVSYQTATQGNPWNLSPPLITQETGSRSTDRVSDSLVQNLEPDNKITENEIAQSLQMLSRQRTESTCSESEPLVTVEGHQVVKKRSRKTRVYQTSCRVCKEVFPNVMLLKSHMIVHNTVETHLYECHICRHRFTQSCSLLRHLKTSCQENRMKCVPCGRTFHRRNTFEQHMRLHQGGPSNLDESFYDKRPDETEIVEARESDIENNNLAKMDQINKNHSLEVSLRLDLVKTLDKNSSVDKHVPKLDGHDSDSDARTYLYSEGEVHSRYNSDFSDTEWTPPQSPKKICTPQDLSINNSATMTLNLLSAVCSDIREAEKEQELKRKEMEEKQKELETIEILANLKRGAMQKTKTIDPSSSVADLLQISSAVIMPNCTPLNTSFSVLPEKGSDNSHGKSNFPSQNLFASPTDRVRNNSSASSSMSADISQSSSSSFQDQKSPTFASSLNQRVPTVIETYPAIKEPKIPVTVLEVAAEADRRRKERAEKAWQGKLVNAAPAEATTTTTSSAAIEANFANHIKLHQEMSQMKMHYPAIEERLSLLMKAQPSMPDTGVQQSSILSKKMQNQLEMFPPAAPNFQFHSPVSSMSHSDKMSPYIQDDMPQDLSVKRTHQEPKSAPVTSRSRTFSSELLRSMPADNNRLPESPRYMTTDLQRSISLERLRQEQQKFSPGENSKSSHIDKQRHKMPRSGSSSSLPSDITKPKGQGPWELKRPEGMEHPRSYMVPSVKTESSEILATKPSETSWTIRNEMKIKPEASERSGSLHSESKRSDSSSAPPPALVPMFQCELCSRSLYNKTDLHLHMMEHGRSAGALYKLLQSNQSQPLLQSSQSQHLLQSSQSQHLLSNSQSHHLLQSSQSQHLLPNSQSHHLLQSSQSHPLLQSQESQKVLQNNQSQQMYQISQSKHFLQSNQTQQQKQSSEAPLDFTRRASNPKETLAIPDSRPRPAETRLELPHSKPLPPLSLDLSGRKSDNLNRSFNHSPSKHYDISPGSQSEPTIMLSAVKESLSPVTSSDMSDSLSSPSTPSGSGNFGASVDTALRQELRLKIFSRRRSQGLDDLKVEFKTPEPTEMTEMEKLKLLYRRECNRQAAQRSRMRKKDLVDSLLEELHKEEVVHSDLRRKMEALAAEKMSLLKALRSHDCVKDPNKSPNKDILEAIDKSNDKDCVKLLDKFQNKDCVIARERGTDNDKTKSRDVTTGEKDLTDVDITPNPNPSVSQTIDHNDSENKTDFQTKTTSVLDSDVRQSLDSLIDKCVEHEKKAQSLYIPENPALRSFEIIIDNDQNPATACIDETYDGTEDSEKDNEKMYHYVMDGMVQPSEEIKSSNSDFKSTSIYSASESVKLQTPSTSSPAVDMVHKTDSLTPRKSVSEEIKEMGLGKYEETSKETAERAEPENNGNFEMPKDNETPDVSKMLESNSRDKLQAKKKVKVIWKQDNKTDNSSKISETKSVANIQQATTGKELKASDNRTDISKEVETKSIETTPEMSSKKVIERKLSDTKSSEKDKSATERSNSIEDKNSKKEVVVNAAKSVKDQKHSRHSRDEESPIYKLLTSKEIIRNAQHKERKQPRSMKRRKS